MAPRDVMAGEEWATAIMRGITGADGMLLVFSSRSNNSPQVRREIERAVGKKIPIYPVRIEDIMPSEAMEYYISSSHWVDAFPEISSHSLQNLLKAIRSREACLPESGVGENTAMETQVDAFKEVTTECSMPGVMNRKDVVRNFYNSHKKKILKNMLLWIIIGSVINIIPYISMMTYIYEDTGSFPDVFSSRAMGEIGKMHIVLTIPYALFGVIVAIISDRQAKKTLLMPFLFLSIIFLSFLSILSGGKLLTDIDFLFNIVPFLLSIFFGIGTIIGVITLIVSRHVES